MVRKLTALFFLAVMTLVIGLHSPVFGYCAAEDTVFVSEHLVESHCHHDCGHEEEPEPLPCEEEHEFITVDAGDYQWSPLSLCDPPVVLMAEDFCPQAIILASVRAVCQSDLPEHDPPPPGLPIFRRNGVLRL